MRAANQTVKMNPAARVAIDTANCQTGTPNGIRTIITIGEVKGMTESQKESGLEGLLITKEVDRIKAKMSGSVTGSINCWVSVSLSTAEPIAANKALYNKYPPI